MKKDLSVLNGEVVYTESGKKARGKYLIKQGKKRTTIYRVSVSGRKTTFIGYSKKMPEKVQVEAERLQKIRRKKQANKFVKESGLTKFAKEEYERKTLQKSNKETSFSEPDSPQEIINQDFERDYTEQNSKLTRESVKDLEKLRELGALGEFDDKTGIFVKALYPKETQEMMNFERILTVLEQDGVITQDKIDLVTQVLGLRPSESVNDFTNTLFIMYREGDSNQRNDLWKILKSLYPDENYVYNPLR